MARRHCTKGVVREDRARGRHAVPSVRYSYVEICLNPLGVPSRMNVGQVLGLTWVGPAKSSQQVATPVVRRQSLEKKVANN